MQPSRANESADGSDLTRSMRALSEQVRSISSDTALLFVTNLQSGDVVDVGPDGIMNTAQYYTRSQADEIIQSLQSLGVTVKSFFSEQEFLRWVVAADRPALKRFEVVFTTAEGGSGSGRRALIPAVGNLLGIPVMNSGAHACSIARHKFHANAVLSRVGVRVPKTWLFRNGDWLNEDRPSNGSRVIVKPTYESMCIGIGDDSVQVVDNRLEEFVRVSSNRFGQPVLVQEFVSGEEVGVPIVRIGTTSALPIVAFRRATGEQYGRRPKTFVDENISRDTSLELYRSEPALYEAVQSAAVSAFDALEMSGIGRVDFRIDQDDRAWVFDTNESPPPLAQTSYAIAMQSLGFSLEEMLSVWLGVCLRDNGIISGV